MNPSVRTPQSVTLYDYFLQAKKGKSKTSDKMPLTDSTVGDCFSTEAQKGSANSKKKQSVDGLKLSPGTLIDLNSEDLLPGFQQHPAFNASNIQVEDLVLCHMTDYLSPLGNIPSNLESGYSPRSTIHFSLNHPVKDIPGQGTVWKTRKYCIIIPMKEALKLNGKPAGCLEVDTYWNKTFDYNSSQSILIVQDEAVAEGKIKLLNPSSQGLSKESKILVLATCDLPHYAAKKILPKMGRTLLEGGEITWGDSGKRTMLCEFDKDFQSTLGSQRIGFKRFLRNYQLQEMMHYISPYMKYEFIILRVQILQLLNQDRWHYNGTNYQEILLKNIQQLEQSLKEQEQKKLKCNEVSKIIQKATTPSDAVMEIQSALNIQHIMEPVYFQKLKGMAKQMDQFPEQKKQLFLHHDVLYQQNLSDENSSAIQIAKENLLGDIPIYIADPCSKGAFLEAIYLTHLSQQEDKALLAVLENACKDPDTANQFPVKKAQFQQIRNEFRQKRTEITHFKKKLPEYVAPESHENYPGLYKNILTKNIKKVNSAE